MTIFSIITFLLYIFILYTLICGNFRFHRRGFVGRVYRFLLIDLWNYFSILINSIKPRWIGEISSYSCLGTHGYFHYAIFIFFLAIYIYFYYEYHITCESVSKSFLSYPYLHKFLMYFVIPWPWIFFVIIWYSDPGEITPENVNYYLKKYPPDNFLYFSNRICPTLNIPIVPRSRYCKYSQKRIAKYDHYCPWVLTPIGEKNIRYFILFLLSCIISSTYYSFLYTSYLIWRMKNVYHNLYSQLCDIESNFTILKETLTIILDDYSSIICCSFGLALIAFVLTYYVITQISQVSNNLLTIEQEKIQAIIQDNEENNVETNYHNIYDKGFFENWKECFFP